MSASTIDDGPTNGSTRMPAACAAAASAAPGSAMAGQPASESRPMEMFSCSFPMCFEMSDSRTEISSS